MTVYVIIEIKVLDKALYAEYIKKVPPIVRQYGGRYLVRGGETAELAGGWHPERIILLEFNAREQVHAWLASPEYAEVAPLRTRSTSSKAIIVESCP